MEAGLKSLKDILGQDDKQFRIPNFQRSYSWKREQYERLYEDFLEAFREKKEKFLGSLVIKNYDSDGLSQFDVIDGQQRLMTIAILYIALRDLCEEKNQKTTADSFEQYLINKIRDGDERFRIVAKNNDHKILTGLIGNSSGQNREIISEFKDSGLIHPYEYFKKELKSLGIDSLANFRDIVSNRIKFVYITIGVNEDEYVIFECLNARGTPLTQPELINNLILMSVDESRRDEIYKKYILHWEKEAEEILDLSHRDKKKSEKKAQVLTQFFFTFHKSFKELKENQVYSEFREKFCDLKLDPSDKIEILEEISRAFSYYKKILTTPYPKDPENELDRVLYRIARTDLTVCYPFLITLFENYEHKKTIDKSKFIEILQTTENYIVRNTLSRTSTTGLNKVFITLAKAVRNDWDEFKPSEIVNKLPYPTDEEIREKLIILDAYKSLKNSTLIPIFQAIEDYYSKEEKRDEWFHLNDEYQIEHIYPQKFEKNVYNTSEEDHKKLVNTIGNLTMITGKNNASASNRSFEEKKANYRRSSLRLNKFLVDQGLKIWDKDSIRDRTNDLTEIILMIFPDLAGKRNKDNRRAPSTKVFGVKVGEKEFKTESWADGFHRCVNYALLLLGAENKNKIFHNEHFKKLIYDSVEVEKVRSRCRKLENHEKYLNVNLSSEAVKRYTEILSDIIGQPIKWITEED